MRVTTSTLLLVPVGILGGDAGTVREAVGIGLAVGEGRAPHLLAVGDRGLIGRKLLDGLPILATDRVQGIGPVDEVILGDIGEAFDEVVLEGGLILLRGRLEGAGRAQGQPDGHHDCEGLVHLWLHLR